MSQIASIVIEVEDSSSIQKLTYSINRENLWVEFKTGAVYSYYGIPLSALVRLIHEPASIGKCFHEVIKSKPYKFELVSVQRHA